MSKPGTNSGFTELDQAQFSKDIKVPQNMAGSTPPHAMSSRMKKLF